MVSTLCCGCGFVSDSDSARRMTHGEWNTITSNLAAGTSVVPRRARYKLFMLKEESASAIGRRLLATFRRPRREITASHVTPRDERPFVLFGMSSGGPQSTIPCVGILLMTFLALVIIRNCSQYVYWNAPGSCLGGPSSSRGMSPYAASAQISSPMPASASTSIKTLSPSSFRVIFTTLWLSPLGS